MRCHQPGEQDSPGGSICFELVSNIWFGFLMAKILGYWHRVAEIGIVTLTSKPSDPLGKILLSAPITLGYAGPDYSGSRVRAVLLMPLAAPTTNMPLN